MLKRSVLLGGLIAGAFLLPTVAGAGLVTGPCVNCHTMHDSQGGVDQGTAGQNPNLLLNAGCGGCHATANPNTATGKSAVAPFAPQVNDATNPLSGGYFDIAAADNTHHNVLDLTDNVDAALGNVAPGGTDLGAQLQCVGCHNGSGGHHGTSGGFRLLGFTGGTPAANYGVDLASADGLGQRSAAQYDATQMNAKCASCHGGFHQAAPPVGAGNQQSALAGTWIRHPTDVQVANGATAPSIVAMDWTGDTDVNPVGTNGTTNDIVMCISCHVAHGSANADLLSFNYGGSGSYAGDNDNSAGCERCHDYAGTGM